MTSEGGLAVRGEVRGGGVRAEKIVERRKMQDRDGVGDSSVLG